MPARIDLDLPRLRALDDRRQVALQLLDRQAAQRVVAAERHDQHAHVASSAQSSRLSPPADVSPDTPALTTS